MIKGDRVKLSDYYLLDDGSAAARWVRAVTREFAEKMRGEIVGIDDNFYAVRWDYRPCDSHQYEESNLVPA